jgi:dihydroorotase-like cyclic amidohydrolase
VTADLLITNGLVHTESGTQRLDVVVEGGRIVGLTLPGENALGAHRTIDADGLILLPGVIDTHVHARDPGFTYKEDYATASRAAAAGGVTLLMDMPNTDPPPNTLERFLEHRANAASKAVINFSHWASPTQRDQIPLIAEAGAIGFKFFMKSAHYPYGSEYALVDDADILETFRCIAAANRWCLVHPHNQQIWEYRVATLTALGRTGLKDWDVATYGDADVVETTPIASLVLMANAVGARLRILHVQGRAQTRLVRMLKREGYRVLAETSPWGIKRAGPRGFPPEDIVATWEAIADGTIDIVGSDHAPHTREEHMRARENAFESVIAGHPFTEHYLSIYLTEGVHAGRIELGRLVEILSTNVAKHLGLYPRKGVIRVGSDADIVVVDLDRAAVLGDSFPVYSKIGLPPWRASRSAACPSIPSLRAASSWSMATSPPNRARAGSSASTRRAGPDDHGRTHPGDDAGRVRRVPRLHGPGDSSAHDGRVGGAHGHQAHPHTRREGGGVHGGRVRTDVQAAWRVHGTGGRRP